MATCAIFPKNCRTSCWRRARTPTASNTMHCFWVPRPRTRTVRQSTAKTKGESSETCLLGWTPPTAAEVGRIICSRFPDLTNFVADTENTNLDAKSDKVQVSKEDEGKSKQAAADNLQPWQTLVSYVDELTLGGRRNSKGHYIDGMGNFPGFGKPKPPKVPANCFPATFYNR